LVRLYTKYYEYSFGQPVHTEQVVRGSGVSSANSDLANRYVNYLAQSSRIKQENPLEEKYPKYISITRYGIGTIEMKEEELSKLHDDIRFKILTRTIWIQFLRSKGVYNPLLTSTLSNVLDRMSVIRIL
jgi:hypothetical protein